MKESRNLEFKSDTTKSFLKTVSAFANFGTGKILFGVADDGTVIGMSSPGQVCLDLENMINDTISPKPDYSMSVDDVTGIITLEVREGEFKPYLYRGKAYRRSDTASIEVDQIELKRLTLQGMNMYYEELPCDEKECSFSFLESKMIELLSIQKLSDDMLRSLGFYTKDRKLNHAAALFSDHNLFPGIDIVRFGDTINIIKERQTYDHMSVLKQYDLAIEMYQRYYQYDQIQGIVRKTKELVPERAFREALANALVHRTWDMNAHIRISMYKDRIEISSPGGLPAGISEDEYLNGNISTLRNPTVANIFFRLHYIEAFGTGIRRINDAYRSCQTTPDYWITDNTITVVLPVMTPVRPLTSEQQGLLECMQLHVQYTSREISERMSWSKDKTIRELNTLIENGYIQKYGSGRGTRYEKKS